MITNHVVAPDKRLKSVCFINPSTGFVSGGITGEEGYIYGTTDGGIKWQLILSTNWSINDINFLDPHKGFACGDSLHIVKSIDQGVTWDLVQLSWLPYPEYIIPLKHIEFADDTTWYFTGGQNYEFGVNVRTQNGGSWWDMEVFQVELNSAYFSEADVGLVAGYGIVYITYDGNSNFVPSDFQGDNITSLSFVDPMHGFASGYNGGIFQSDDGGATWHAVLKPNGYIGSRVHFNDIEFTGITGVAVGNRGIIYYSSNDGISWDLVNIDSDIDFYNVKFVDGQYYVCGEDGIFLKIHF